MDQSEFDIEADLPQRGRRSQAARKEKRALVRVIEEALPEALVRRARAAVSRLGGERLRESYFTTFWLPRGEQPLHALEHPALPPPPHRPPPPSPPHGR